MRLKLFLSILFGMSISAHASVMLLDKEVFRCSDGQEYGVLRHYSGGWGPGSWNLSAFCSEETLTQKHYQGRILPVRSAHPDVADCQDEDSKAIRKCFREFVDLNGSQGEGLSPIKHGNNNSASSPNSNSGLSHK
jgi:hypothetical protein